MVIALTLIAAVLHATWNAVAHGAGDRLVSFALMSLSYVAAGGVSAVVLGERFRVRRAVAAAVVAAGILLVVI